MSFVTIIVLSPTLKRTATASAATPAVTTTQSIVTFPLSSCENRLSGPIMNIRNTRYRAPTQATMATIRQSAAATMPQSGNSLSRSSAARVAAVVQPVHGPDPQPASLPSAASDHQRSAPWTQAQASRVAGETREHVAHRPVFRPQRPLEALTPPVAPPLERHTPLVGPLKGHLDNFCHVSARLPASARG